MKRTIIAVDFDGTLCENKWPEIGAPNDELIVFLRRQALMGDALILWTCRNGALLEDAVKWCEEKGLIFDAVNENLPEVLKEHGGIDSRKITATVYIDDRNLWTKKVPGMREDDIFDCSYQSIKNMTMEDDSNG